MYIDFDEETEAIINPTNNSKIKLPSIAISCYSPKIIQFLLDEYEGELVYTASKVNIYRIKYQEKYFTTFTSPMGSSWASMVLEELIPLGIEKIIYFGSCGVLEDIGEYNILIPYQSRREEGTSYHYIKEGKYIPINNKYKEEFIKILEKENYNYKLCKTWTTDAPYRETRNKVQKYLSEGISCVEMEASALATIGIYRNIDVFIFFYAADNLSKTKWNKRNLGRNDVSKKNSLALLALTLAENIIDN